MEDEVSMEDKDSEEANAPMRSVIAEEVATANSEFIKKWGWLQLVRQVAEYLHTTFFDIMENRGVLEVLTIVVMMQEDMERKSLQSNA